MNREQGGRLVRQAWNNFYTETGDNPGKTLIWADSHAWNEEAERRIFDAVNRAVRAEIKADPKCPNCESNQASANETTELLGQVIVQLEQFERFLEVVTQFVVDEGDSELADRLRDALRKIFAERIR